ncbi:MAG: Flap endonuclease [Acidimicrobiales bacterium]|nr:Flap endonuclease [Acidimicrobiales bacterium]
MKVHLLDGTYELFRHHFAVPAHSNAAGEPVAATRGVVGSVINLLESGVSHIGVATDHVIESFRNDLYPGYKTSAGMPPELLSQFGLLEDALAAMGVVVWPMVEFEADDALAAMAAVAAADDRVEQVQVMTPDKDLAQCVVDGRVVQVDRRKGGTTLDEAAILERYGVPPESIPDWLALVGDSADGFPGLPGWGAKSAAAVLRRFGHLEEIPVDARRWEGCNVRNGGTLANTLVANLADAVLFRTLARLRRDAPVSAVDDLQWVGPTPGFAGVCERVDAPNLLRRVEVLAAGRHR